MSRKQPFLIGLTGYAGSGKDAVRAALEQELGFIGFAFADPIRAMLRELLKGAGIDAAYMDDRALKEAAIPALGVSYRYMAQTLGTEWGRTCVDGDFWVRLAGAHMADLVDKAGTDDLKFVISDVRFANEVGWVRSRGGVIWRLQRPGLAPVREHVSESGMDDIKPDFVVHNMGTLEDLREVVGMSVAVA